MAKVQEVKDTKTFVPYNITVETEEEHKFLLGLFNLAPKYIKGESDDIFHKLIVEMENR